MFRSCMGLKKRNDESKADFWKRRNKAAGAWIEALGDWRHDLLAFQWKWAGHVARAKNTIMHDCLIEGSLSAQHTHRVLDSRRRLDINRRAGKYGRWENEIFFYMNSKNKNWICEAQLCDAEGWSQYIPDFIRWRLECKLADRRQAAYPMMRRNN